ncbi:TPA: hypothetical protein QDC20_000316 [Burkholderia aenigmatica]|uniref:hypothetical protein n=1 Tax=Burkholderia sp. AU45251 TaxID=3059204 RepID=UPI00264E0DA4|nr:hypothetical protein [Burkholderia sp. AU45251]HDR9483217.1 hypothetical protein [Burkholderia aenigmatica]MDN7516082.1 hypothetical protein [Burkholderia sp. AU45251]HDR9514165.1 hypothetical protein [Burkholderia aenigmatica]HDR9591555.1 hypothetical protein [Burkholderia aenigmatica]HDR9598647.1 hypothetical protein [Burkholderia aenigmatica]
MAATIFFSWQLDRATRTGRNLLERALEAALGRLGGDTDLQEADRNELVLDRDTKNTPGFPPIAQTIFQKIDAAAVFVPDFTFVGERADGRPTPNPNVLIEYGWALKALGHGRIVPVMNTAFGEPSDATLPFDLRHQRHPITYHCPEDADEATRKAVREKLTKDLEKAIRLVITSEDYISALPQPPVPEPFEQLPEVAPGRLRPLTDPVGISAHILEQDKEVLLADRSLMWLRVMPEHATHRLWTTDEIRAALRASPDPVRLLWDGYGGHGELRHADGFGIFARRPGEEEASGLAFAFKAGEVWTVDALYLDCVAHKGVTSIPDAEMMYALALKTLGTFEARLGIPPPYRWIAGMSGLRGRGMEVPHAPGRASLPGPRGSCLQDVVIVTGTYAAQTSPVLALKPFWEAIYESCGLSRPQWLDSRTL